MNLHLRDPLASERHKYETMWAHENYVKANRAGTDNVPRFIEIMKPKANQSVIDLGCGPGHAGLMLAEDALLDVHWLDITDAALDPRVPRNRFIPAPIWAHSWRAERRIQGWDFGFCVDVIEHLPTEYTMLAIERIVANCRTSWLQIALLPDGFGQVINDTLHLTVRPFEWWRDRIADMATLVECRDLCGRGLYVVQK